MSNKDYTGKINFFLGPVLLAMSLVFSCSQILQAVPVIPNEGIIEGRVVGYCKISSSVLNIKPARTLYRLEILLTASGAVEGKPNFGKDTVGEKIEVYSGEKLAGDFFDQNITARIIYRGDEKGGLNWIRNIKILKAKKEIKQ